MPSAKTYLLSGLVMGPILACQTRPAPQSQSQSQRDATSMRLHTPAVAGTFYPSDPKELRDEVDRYLAEATKRELRGLRALISPHAGYRYSGPIAATGYKQLIGLHFDRIVILAPSHRVVFHGVAIPDADAIRMPLGDIQFSAAAKKLGENAPFVIDSAPHAREHALEVQLPFLQRVLGQFELVPLVLGDVDTAEVARQLDPLIDPQSLLIASSDLSHYHPYEQAKELDEATAQTILKLDVEAMKRREACGKGPILALLHLARARGWRPTLLDARSSGDTASDRSRVVGYASIAFTEAE